VLQHVEETDWPSIFWHLPLLTMDEAAGFHSPYWRKHLQTPISDGSYWDAVRYQRRMTSVDVPVLHISGWYDDVQRGTTENFTRMTTPGVDDGIRGKQSLLMGPWDHRLTMTRERRLGPIDFGADAEMDLRGYEFDWLDGVLGDGPGVPPVRVFVMGQNAWRDEQEWPLARTRWTEYHLASDGNANTRHGDGRLSEAPAGGVDSDTFAYDPADPVPFLSDHASSMQIGGPDDYAEVEERADVLVYTTPVLDADVEVTGPVRAVLHVSTSARDTDFTAKLVDVHPDGFCQRICDGLVRARFRNGYDEAEQLVEPEAVFEVEIDMWSTSHTFLDGHAIRLEVSSSAFPKYDRNLNTGGSIATETEMVVATNRVWHSADAPSRLILPVIPG
jgi:putative CocE/NonD family hydrolase